jgi:uncharacterized protein (DUF4213/DUF364 family)
VKSWNYIEASLGMAAINCYYNNLNKLGLLTGTDAGPVEKNSNHDAFQTLASVASGKNVAVIGRFPNLEVRLASNCRLSVLERNPEPGDYPDSACEYILPEQDMVFITGMTLTNKTLPRLLQLIRHDARVVLVGPSVPISPVLFEYGVTDLDGFCVTDAQQAAFQVKRGDKAGIFTCGRKVVIGKQIIK